jgi:hypothetical protein
MLAPAKVEEIEGLLRQGRSERAVSKQTGVSRISVNRINRRLKGLPDKVKAPQIRITHGDERDGNNSSPNRPQYVRCPGCGGMQQADVPCLVCSTRKANRDSYDCYMEELLTPSSSLSPLSAKKPQNHRRECPPRFHKAKGTAHGSIR